MASKNLVHYDAAQMESLIILLANCAKTMEVLCTDITRPVTQLVSDEYIEGSDTDAYKESFREVQAGAEVAKATTLELSKVCKEIADSMGLALSVTKKSAEQLNADMKAVTSGIKDSKTAN